MTESMSALSSGQTLDQRFTLLRPLGRDGVAETWLVRDAETGEDVVARILPPDASEERVSLLRRQCREARRLVHPAIARVFEFHRTTDRAFLTMEFVDGEDLGQLRGRPLAEILPVVSSVAAALAYAHSRGVVHGNLEIANVLRDASGQARLVDFGVAGEAARPADDLYSFGVLLYELTTGHAPSRPEITERRVRGEAPAPIAGAGPLPARYRSLIRRLLARDPAERPPDMASVESELGRVRDDLAGLAEARPGTAEPARVNPPPRVGTIAPVPVRAAPGSTERAARRPIAVRLGIPAVLTLAGVGLLAFVFVLLPRWAPSPAGLAQDAGASGDPVEAAAPVPPGPPANPGQVDAAPPPAEDLQERAYLRQRAERALNRLLELREDLERRGVEAWGGETYTTAVAHADAGDVRLGRADYAAAQGEYEQAVRLLDALGIEAVDVLRRALADGERALRSGDEARATAAFALAAEIAPANKTAATGLRRAEVVDEVAERLSVAVEREHARDWVGAERAYRQAVALDPLSLTAQESLARVQARLSDDRFAGFMSRGLAALRRGEYAEARQAFERAASIRPDSSQVAEGLLQVDEAEKLDAFVDHRRQATEFEAAEQWEAAAEQYEAVLRLAPNVAFALQGVRRCRRRADLARRMTYHLDHPDRLSADEVLAEATALAAEASEVEPAGPRHLAQLDRLEKLLATARTLVRIRLESDNLTQVTVYHVGRLGTFLHHELELRPGRYTVVGSRQGYRDVRRDLVVVAGQEPGPFVVRCVEKI